MKDHEIGTNLKFELNILMGLPGSGKSYYAHTNYPQVSYCHDGKVRIDLDNIRVDSIDKMKIAIYKACDKTDLQIFCERYSPDSNVVNVCVDGLITTKADLLRIASYFVSYITDKYNYNASYSIRGSFEIYLNIHQWNEDRATCAHNDMMRIIFGIRETSARTSINFMPYEILTNDDLISLSEQLPSVKQIKLVPHTVHKANIYDVVFKPLISIDKKEYYGGRTGNSGKTEKTHYMYSESWSGGGTWGNCWGGEGTIDADSPKEFIQFDKLLEKLCPKISFLQYKRLYNACVDTCESREYDYYGGCETHYYWRCDMEKLYELLKYMNIITDYEIVEYA